MNCHAFELQVADWLSGRLTSQDAEKMAAHKESCASCARLADTEVALRRAWSEMRTPTSTVDLWSRVEARLDQPSFRMKARPSFNTTYRWAAAVCALAILVPAGLTLSNRYPPPVGPGIIVQHPGTQNPAPNPVITSTPGLAYTLIGDAGQADPSIDDPIGGTMEHVWTQVATDNNNIVSR